MAAENQNVNLNGVIEVKIGMDLHETNKMQFRATQDAPSGNNA